jgi:hypothetical protein
MRKVLLVLPLLFTPAMADDGGDSAVPCGFTGAGHPVGGQKFYYPVNFETMEEALAVANNAQLMIDLFMLTGWSQITEVCASVWCNKLSHGCDSHLGYNPQLGLPAGIEPTAGGEWRVFIQSPAGQQVWLFCSDCEW